MNLKKLLQKGYFPKELPPPFSTKLFANSLKRITASSALYSATEPKESKPGKFSILKGKVSRRKLEIPHPKHFLALCQNIVTNWSIYKSIYGLSSYSESSPVVRKSAARALDTKSKSLNEFRLGLLRKAYNKSYELRFDISQFYPTIYTHSITWAIMGKEDAKFYFKKKRTKRSSWGSLVKTDPKAKLYDLCNNLDALIRSCQERQSVGIPIGPDTSLIIAEMIGSRLDYEIRNLVGDKDMCSRYFDDYYFYLGSRAAAERVLKFSQKIINDYKLEVNESKVTILESPFSFEYEWANILSSYRFRNNDQFELRTFFDIVHRLIFRFAGESSQIIHYSLQRFEYGNVPIKKDCWFTFLLLALHLQTIDASNLNQFLKILLSYEAYWGRHTYQSIKSTLESIVERHIIANHSFEVSWSLWIMISLNLKCSTDLLNKVMESQDTISRLVCLDMIHRKLYMGKRPSTAHIFRSLIQEDLYGENWLFAYESVFKRWLSKSSTGFLNIDPFIKLLHSCKVEFYLGDNQINLEFVYNPELKNPIIKEKLTKGQKLELLLGATQSKY